MTRNVVRESFIYPGVNSIQNNSFLKISLNNVHVDQCRQIFHLKSRSLTANSENDPHPSHPKGCLDQGLIHPPGLFVELGRAMIGNYTSRKGVGGREALPPPPSFSSRYQNNRVPHVFHRLPGRRRTCKECYTIGIQKEVVTGCPTCNIHMCNPCYRARHLVKVCRHKIVMQTVVTFLILPLIPVN